MYVDIMVTRMEEKNSGGEKDSKPGTKIASG